MKPSRFRTSAIPSLSRENGMSTVRRRIELALRTRVSMSATGSVSISSPPACLPRRLLDAGDLAPVRQVPEADAAHLELAEVGPRAAAEAAAVLVPARLARRPSRPD